jgi:hypothetical protein
MNPLTAKPKEGVAARGPKGLDERDATEHDIVARVKAYRKK